MPTRQGFQSLAKKLKDGTFKDFNKPVVFTKESYSYNDDSDDEFQVLAKDETTGIRLSFNKFESQVDGVESGDFKVLVLVEDISFDLKTSGVKMLFDGVELDIVDVMPDTADATYTIHARVK